MDRLGKLQPYHWVFKASNEVDWHQSATNSNIKYSLINSSWQRWNSFGDADVHPPARSVRAEEIGTVAKGTALPAAQLQQHNLHKDRSKETQASTFLFLIKLIP